MRFKNPYIKLQDSAEITGFKRQIKSSILTPYGEAKLILDKTGQKLQDPAEITAFIRQVESMKLTKQGKKDLIERYIGTKPKVNRQRKKIM